MKSSTTYSKTSKQNWTLPMTDASLGLLSDTDDDVPPEVEEDVVEYDVIDGDVHPRQQVVETVEEFGF